VRLPLSSHARRYQPDWLFHDTPQASSSDSVVSPDRGASRSRKKRVAQFRSQGDGTGRAESEVRVHNLTWNDALWSHMIESPYLEVDPLS
jgi:hypothetical protein